MSEPESEPIAAPPIAPESFVRPVLDAHPAAVAVMIRRGMHCPGCVMAPFMTLAEAAANYRLDPETLVAELRAAVAAGGPGRRT